MSYSNARKERIRQGKKKRNIVITLHDFLEEWNGWLVIVAPEYLGQLPGSDASKLKRCGP